MLTLFNICFMQFERDSKRCYPFLNDISQSEDVLFHELELARACVTSIAFLVTQAVDSSKSPLSRLLVFQKKNST